MKNAEDLATIILERDNTVRLELMAKYQNLSCFIDKQGHICTLSVEDKKYNKYHLLIRYPEATKPCFRIQLHSTSGRRYENRADCTTAGLEYAEYIVQMTTKHKDLVKILKSLPNYVHPVPKEIK
jgi:hypothetical protein